MFPFAFYLLKVIICSGILFGYYWLLLRNKIYHRYNRFYLLATVAISLFMPLIQINIWHRADAPAQSIKLLQVVTGSGEYMDEIILTARQNNFTAEQVAMLFYIITCFIFCSFFIHVLLKIRTLLQHHQQTVIDNICFVNTTAKGTPFSFLKYIFWNDHIDRRTITGNQIFKHELAHVQQKHSYDKLMVNAIHIFYWGNPFFWLIRKELNLIHEFMADKIAVEDSDTEAFAAMILQATYPQHQFALTNPFFYSPIKRRLIMLTKNKNPKASYIGRVLVLPLAVLLFAAFTLKTKTIINAPVYHGKKITVVLDAGHGGKDFGAVSVDGKLFEKDLDLSIVQKIKALNNNPDINIVLTRNTDVYSSPQEKADFANAQKPDLFVSFHIDASKSPDSSSYHTGLSTWVSKEGYANSSKSKLFASAIIQEFSTNYGLPVLDLPNQHENGIWVLQATNCPAVLIEAGFITNKKDLRYLQTEEAQETIAKNVLAAVMNYANQKNIIKESNENENLLNILTNDTLPENSSSSSLVKMKMKKDIYKGTKIKNIYLRNTDNKIVIFLAGGKEIVLEPEEAYKEKLILPPPPPPPFGASTALANGVKDILRNDLNSLYVLDEVLQDNSFKPNSVPTQDIEQISILKGQVAFDKYGDKGKNGIIEIYTKKIPHTYLNQYYKDDKIFPQVKNEPKFPGGEPAWLRFLTKNIDPGIPVDNGAPEGTYKVIVKFIVNKDGTISDVHAETKHGYGMDSAAVELIKKGPRWEPATQNGNIVTAYKKQPITFVIEEQK